MNTEASVHLETGCCGESKCPLSTQDLPSFVSHRGRFGGMWHPEIEQKVSQTRQGCVAASFKRQTVTWVLERTGVGTVLLRNCAMVSWSQVNMKWHLLLVSSPNAPSTSHSPEITTLVNTAINSLWTINFFKVSAKLTYKSSLINSSWK